MTNPLHNPPLNLHGKPMALAADFSSAFFADLAVQRDAHAQGRRPVAFYPDPPVPDSPVLPSERQPPTEAIPCPGLTLANAPMTAGPMNAGPITADFDSMFFADLAANAADRAIATRPQQLEGEGEGGSALTSVNPWTAMQAALALPSALQAGLALPLVQEGAVLPNLVIAGLTGGGESAALPRLECQSW